MRFENSSVRPQTIGPKIAIGPKIQAQDIISGIRSELLFAMNASELGDRHPELIDLTKRLSSADRETALSLRPFFYRMGDTPLETAFFKAMAFNLDYLAKMP